MANLIAIPVNHADQMFLNHKFFKQYDKIDGIYTYCFNNKTA